MVLPGSREILREYPATHDDRVLLILRHPRGFGHQALAFQQELKRLVLREQRHPGLAMPFLALGNGWVVQDFQTGVAFLQAANHIIDVPARHDDQHGRVLVEAGTVVVGEPIPRSIADGLRAGFGSALERVVDHAKVQG